MSMADLDGLTYKSISMIFNPQERKAKSEESAQGSSVVKDLRSRRVFSPSSINIQEANWFSCKNKNPKGTDLVSCSERDGISSDDLDFVEKLDAGSSCKERNLENVHNRSSVDKDRVEGESLIGLEKRVAVWKLGLKILCSQCHRMLRSFGKRKLERNASAEMNFTVHVLEKQSKESIQQFFGGSRMGDCGNKSVFNPLAHAKLFKRPGSFSYRRLLPFLTDITKELCCEKACWKASEAELANQRLNQMNNDLNIHCRITCGKQPRVKFANFDDEHIIFMTDSPNR